MKPQKPAFRHFLVISWLLFPALVGAGTVDIYLIAGQSNADGRAPGTGLPTTPINLQAAQSDVPFFYRTTQSATPVYETLRPGASGTVGAFGPEITLGRSLADWVATNQPANKVAFIKYAVGGTSLSADWKAGGTAANTGDGVYYKTFQTVVTAGLAALDGDASLSGYTKRIAGIIWVQGEKDSLTALESQAYQANLTAFIADIRMTYGTNLPFFFSKLSDNQTAYPNGTGEGPAGFIAVRAAQAAVAASVAGAVQIDSDPAEFAVGTDNIHYNAAGQQALGNAFAAAVIAAPAIVLPEITVQPASAEISAGQTTTLQVTATGLNLSYQWYAGASGTTTSPVAGATSASFATPALTGTASYWVRVSNTGGTADSTAAFVSVRSAYETWARAAGFLPDEQTLDPDGDGIMNLLEFALGGNPNSPLASPLTTVNLPASDALHFAFHRASADVRYVVESSTTLAPGSWTTEFAIEKNSDPASVGQDVVVEVPLGEVAKKFLRLRVLE